METKHRIEEHLMLNRIKHNWMLMNTGEMKEDRSQMFLELQVVWEKYRRVNQWV